MRALYIDAGMGAAGDMLSAALLCLIPDKDGFIEKLNSLGLPGVKYSYEKSEKCGISGLHVTVSVFGTEESSDELSDTEHEHRHHDIKEIRKTVDGIQSLDPSVKNDILSVYDIIAKAESTVHGETVENIHFHEVGSLDAIADVTAVCMLMNEISPDRVIVSPVNTGSGYVKCSHGNLPVPVPAVAEIFKNVPFYRSEICSELCTPTGAALLKYFGNEFSEMPVMKIDSIGYGMGKKDFEKANCIRVFCGETGDECEDAVYCLSCNIDDMPGEKIAFACEELFEKGALDVFTSPVGMKKSRQGILLTVICHENDRNTIIKEIFKHTSTLGIREEKLKRYILDRNIIVHDTVYGRVREKVSSGYGVKKSKFEYDDIAAIAKKEHISAAEAERRVNGIINK